MLLVVDIGNTIVSLGVFNKNSLIVKAGLSSIKKSTSHEYAIMFHNVLALHTINPLQISDAIISSVVPSLLSVIIDAIDIGFKITPMVLLPGLKTGLNIQVESPSQLGSDLVASAVAVAKKYPMPCAIYDLGTATTVSVMSDKGIYIGNAICPGVHISLEALKQNTAQLLNVALDSPGPLIGKNTVDSMKSGIIYGTAAMLDGFALRIEEELNMECVHIATGGVAHLVIPHCMKTFVHDKYLVFEGLRLIYEKNTQSEAHK